MATREFRDPIHRFVHFTPDEMEIIDSKPFQRLRFIHQLGMTYYVYPGAKHTRFEHSLGVAELASKVFDVLKEKDNDVFENIINKDEFETYRKKLRIAGLLHDIGHFPFSHSAEGIWPKKHELYSKDIILHDPIKKIIEEDCSKEIELKADEISYIVSGEPEFADAKLTLLYNIINGDLGVDRIDYLVRDSLHTGVLYGMFDYHRLLDTFTVSLDWEDNPLLCLEKGGIHSAEGLIMARYFMFLQVYFHKTRRAYDLHYADYLNLFLNYAKDELKIDYRNYEHLLELNDYTMLNQMKTDSEIEKCNKRCELAKLIIGRAHHHLAKNIDGNILSGDKKSIYKEFESRLEKEFETEVQNGIIKFDKAESATNKFEKAYFFIINEDSNMKLILTESKLIEKLNDINIFRVYVKRGYEHIEPTVKSIINDVKEKYS